MGQQPHVKYFTFYTLVQSENDVFTGKDCCDLKYFQKFAEQEYGLKIKGDFYQSDCVYYFNRKDKVFKSRKRWKGPMFLYCVFSRILEPNINNFDSIFQNAYVLDKYIPESNNFNPENQENLPQIKEKPKTSKLPKKVIFQNQKKFLYKQKEKSIFDRIKSKSKVLQIIPEVLLPEEKNIEISKEK